MAKAVLNAAISAALLFGFLKLLFFRAELNGVLSPAAKIWLRGDLIFLGFFIIFIAGAVRYWLVFAYEIQKNRIRVKTPGGRWRGLGTILSDFQFSEIKNLRISQGIIEKKWGLSTVSFDAGGIVRFKIPSLPLTDSESGFIGKACKKD